MDFEKIYRQCFRDVFLYACGLTGNQDLAEEITQETFVKALKAIDSFDGEKDIRAWLFTIAKNAWISYCRKQRKQTPLPEEDIIPDTGITFVQDLEDRDTALQIYEKLHELTEPYKEVFMLRVMGELPFEQIGRIFGKSPGWARVVFFRAKNMVLNEMEGEHE